MNKVQIRILAISLSTYGFGYAVMENGCRLVNYGKKVIPKDKNTKSLAGIEKMMVRSKPEFLVLQDVDAEGTHRAPRIKELHKKVLTLAKKHKLKSVKISQKQLRLTLLGREDGTKQEMAELMASRFSDELSSRLPPKRKPWLSEDSRMDIFDAVGLVAALQLINSQKRQTLLQA